MTEPFCTIDALYVSLAELLSQLQEREETEMQVNVAEAIDQLESLMNRSLSPAVLQQRLDSLWLDIARYNHTVCTPLDKGSPLPFAPSRDVQERWAAELSARVGGIA